MEFVGLDVDESNDHPVTVTLRCVDTERHGEKLTCPPSTSWDATAHAAQSRASIGREFRGDLANHAWGVMDILAVTDFPDIRLKCAIQSGNRAQYHDHPS